MSDSKLWGGEARYVPENPSYFIPVVGRIDDRVVLLMYGGGQKVSPPMSGDDG